MDFEILRGVFDLNVEQIFPPFQFYERIKKFFPSYPICFEETNTRTFNKDGYTYKQIFCNYTLFKKYLKTFPILKIKIKDFNETFEFTYKDSFKPIYNNKYYLFLLFMREAFTPNYIFINLPQWILGRLFLKKYQFVFDATNKKVGYYKLNNIIINDTNTDNIIETDTNKESDINKENNDKEKETKKKIIKIKQILYM